MGPLGEQINVPFVYHCWTILVLDMDAPRAIMRIAAAQVGGTTTGRLTS